MDIGSWLRPLAGKFLSQGAAKLSLGAFGKHPGWDDHIHDLDLDTEPLVIARRLLYVEGIGGAIGEWDKLEDREKLPGFDHLFCWFAGNDLLVGRIWSSSDGKGRKHYPMIVCAHLSGHCLDAAIEVLAEALRVIEGRCREAATADDVRAVLVDGAGRLLAGLEGVPENPGQASTEAARVTPGGWGLNLGVNGEELYRAFYAVTSQLNGAGIALADRIDGKLAQSNSIAQSLRLPADRAREVPSILFWRAVLARLTALRVPTLFLAPAGEGWVDVIIGKPGPREIVCLRASSVRIPLASDVPYELPDEFKAEMTRRQVGPD